VFSFVLFSVIVSAEQTHDSLSEENVAASSHVADRVVRDAGHKKKLRRKKKSRKVGKNKARKDKKRRKTKARMGKKGKKSRKSKKDKKNRKKKSKKDGKNKKKIRQGGRNETMEEMPDPAKCLSTTITVLKLFGEKVRNFEKVSSRIKDQARIAAGKTGKVSEFTSAASTVLTAGGGDSSNVTCAKKTGTDGAKALKSIYESLAGCPENITKYCDTDFPALPMKMIDNCTNSTTEFKAAVQKCFSNAGQKQDEQCMCWQGAKLKELIPKVRECQLDGKPFKDGITNCRDAFKICRQAQDKSVDTIAACNLDTSSLITKAQNLARNNASLAKAIVKLQEIVGSTDSSSTAAASTASASTASASTAASGSSRFGETITSCTDLVNNVTAMLELSVSNYQVALYADDIANTTVTTSDCSSSSRELSTLTTLTVSVVSYSESVSTELVATQTLLETATGTTISTSDVPEATASAAAATSTASARIKLDRSKYRNFHAMANHR